MGSPKKSLTVLDQIAASDKVRRQIIEAASALYVKKGFSPTSIQEISEKAGVSLPVTYHYVKKKSEIMRMIMEDVLCIFQKSLTEHLRDLEDPEEKLAIALALYLRILNKHKEKVLLIYQKSAALDKASKAQVMQLEVDVSCIFGEIIADGIRKGAFRSVDVDLMAYNILMMAHMWVLKGWHFRGRLSLDQYIDLQLVNLMNLLSE
jgi:AcrR family transcriptional regulator